MYKYNSLFTAEEAALYAVGLDQKYETIVAVYNALLAIESKNENRTTGEMLDNVIYETAPSDLYELYTEARHIQSAIIADLSWEHDGVAADELDHLIIDRTYLANWFYRFGEVAKAKLFDPFIEKNYKPEALEETSKRNPSDSLGERQEGTYLKIIAALTKALADVSDSTIGGNSLKHQSGAKKGQINVGSWDKDTGGGGVTGLLKKHKYSDLSGSCLEGYIGKALKEL